MGKISYDKDLVMRAAAKRKVPEGWHRFVITEEKNGVSNSNHLMTTVTCAPLTDPEDANSKTSPTVRHNFVWPFANPDVEGHEPPNTGAMLPRQLQGIFGPDDAEGGIPDFPARGKDKVLRYKGEPIEDGDEDEKRQEVVQLAMDKAISIYEGETSLIGEAFYGEVKHQGDFATIARFAFTLPDNAKLADLEQPKATAKEEPKKAKGKGK